MSVIPSVKGSVFVGVVEDVNKLVASRRLERAEVERWLIPEDFALLRRDIVVASWYDIRAYVRMGELLRDVAGGGDNEYLRDRGRATAIRLLDAGLYTQLEYLNRTEVERATQRKGRYAAFGRDLLKLSTLSNSILNFSKWQIDKDPDHRDRYIIDVREAQDFPDVLAWRCDGFVNEMASVHGEPDLWTWSRESSDRIVFRMLRSV